MDCSRCVTQSLDIAGRQELKCWNSSGYPGCQGEVWYVRLLPPFVKGSNRWVTVSTPYVFRDGDRRKWEAFFQRYLGSKYGAGHPLRDYLKYGKSLGYWLEFLFQAYAGHTGNMIKLTGALRTLLLLLYGAGLRLSEALKLEQADM